MTLRPVFVFHYYEVNNFLTITQWESVVNWIFEVYYDSLSLCFTVGPDLSSEGWGDASPEVRRRSCHLRTRAVPSGWWRARPLAVWGQGKESADCTVTNSKLLYKQHSSTHHTVFMLKFSVIVFTLFLWCMFSSWICETQQRMKDICLRIWWLFMVSYLKLSLWVPHDQVGIITGGKAALPAVEATQLSCFLAQEPHNIRELKTSFTGWTPEQRQAWKRWE